jgi:adenosylcobinamide kinase / adenosylcobinamide-phosphate guanylyltransferase
MPSQLILGGARSGKSRRALDLAASVPGERCFIATAEAWDDEMRCRIERHRRERGSQWRTVEEPLELGPAISAASRQFVLVDCLTLWLSNLMHAGRDIDSETQVLLSIVAQHSGEIILVSNEVGFGLVPETPLGRAFRDAQGRLNQRVAAAADRVELVVAGLPLRLKG